MKGSIKGIEQFRKQLEAMDKRLRNKTITKALRDGAKLMLKTVKAKAPVRTGFLKANIKVRMAKRKKDNIRLRVVVSRGGDKRTYIAAFNEYGTRKQPEKPFMRPAFEETKNQVRDQALDQIKQAIEEFAGPKRTANQS